MNYNIRCSVCNCPFEKGHKIVSVGGCVYCLVCAPKEAK